MNFKSIKNSFVLQQGQSDCGVACLCSIIRFHGGEADMEKIRIESGTSKTGTTLLGLHQSASAMGFDSEGLEATQVMDLKELEHPAILHLLMEDGLPHYVVFFGFKEDEIIIGDPRTGIVKYSENDLHQVWKEKNLLKLTPTHEFVNNKKERFKRFKLIYSLLQKDISLLYISVAVGIITALLDLSSAIFSQRLIDDILPAQDKKKLIVSLVSLILLLLCRSGLSYLRGLFIVQQGKQFNIRVIDHFYNTLIRLPKPFFDSRKTGELVSRMNDTTRIQSALNLITGTLTISVLVLIASITLVSIYSTLFFFIVLLFLPLYVVVLLKFNNTISKSQKEVMTNYALSEAHYIDSIHGIVAIKDTASEGWFSKLNTRIYTGLQESIFNLGKTNNTYILIADALGVIFMSCIFGIGSWLIFKNELKIGEFVATIAIAINIGPSITRILLSNIQIQEAVAAFDRMTDITSNQQEQVEADRSNPDMPLDFNKISLKVNNLSFRFTGRELILKNISFSVSQGELITIIGESGGGKSTLLQILQKFYTPEEGIILANNTALEEISVHQWRKNIAVVPQEVKIFNGTILYNITLDEDPNRNSDVIHFCMLHGLDIYFQHLPQGYQTLVGEEGINLSGGQKQIVGFVRALIRKPKLLLLDESTSSMDSKTEAIILDILRKNKNDFATIFVSHRLHVSEISDRTYRLTDGTFL